MSHELRCKIDPEHLRWDAFVREVLDGEDQGYEGIERDGDYFFKMAGSEVVCRYIMAKGDRSGGFKLQLFCGNFTFSMKEVTPSEFADYLKKDDHRHEIYAEFL